MKFKLLFLSMMLFLMSHKIFSAEYGFAAKIISGPCNARNLQLKGSGTLFTYGDAVYFLTSEHVVYHSKKTSFCHTIKNQLIGEAKAELLFADWGTGMALLKVATTPQAQFLNFPDDFRKLETNEVTIVGSPYDQVPVISSNGFVINEEGQRLLSPIIKNTLEIESAHGEFGMSGGPILQMNSGMTVLRGFLSHQVLIMQPGHPTRTGEWNENETNQNQLLGIDVVDVNRELLKYFTSPLKYKVSFYRDPIGQMKNNSVLIGQGLIFTPELVSNVGINKSSFMNIAFTAHGGVDPIGIGGIDSGEAFYTILSVEIFNGTEEFSTVAPSTYSNSFQADLQKMKKILFVNNKVSIPFLVFQNKEDDFFSLTKVLPRSIDEIFSLITDERYSLVVKNLSNGENQKIQVVGEASLGLLQKIKGDNLLLENQGIYADLVTLSQLAKDNNLELVKCSALVALSTRNPAADALWSDLLNINFDVSTKLLQNIKFFAKICH